LEKYISHYIKARRQEKKNQKNIYGKFLTERKKEKDEHMIIERNILV
jgi:hypothetical protein